MKKYKTLSPLPLKGGELVCGRKSPFKGDLEGLVFYNFSFLIFHFQLLLGYKNTTNISNYTQN